MPGKAVKAPSFEERLGEARSGFAYARENPGFASIAIEEFGADKWGAAAAHELCMSAYPGRLDVAAYRRAAVLVFRGAEVFRRADLARGMEWIQGGVQIAAELSGRSLSIKAELEELPPGEALDGGAAKALLESLIIQGELSHAKVVSKASPTL